MIEMATRWTKFSGKMRFHWSWVQGCFSLGSRFQCSECILRERDTTMPIVACTPRCRRKCDMQQTNLQIERSFQLVSSKKQNRCTFSVAFLSSSMRFCTSSTKISTFNPSFLICISNLESTRISFAPRPSTLSRLQMSVSSPIIWRCVNVAQKRYQTFWRFSICSVVSTQARITCYFGYQQILECITFCPSNRTGSSIFPHAARTKANKQMNPLIVLREFPKRLTRPNKYSNTATPNWGSSCHFFGSQRFIEDTTAFPVSNLNRVSNSCANFFWKAWKRFQNAAMRATLIQKELIFHPVTNDRTWNSISLGSLWTKHASLEVCTATNIPTIFLNSFGKLTWVLVFQLKSREINSWCKHCRC